MQVSGFAVDVAKAILDENGIAFDVTLVPWTRCLRDVAEGGRFQMFLNASYSPERARTYHLSHPYYYTTPCYLYSRKQHANGLRIDSKEDLANYNVCGLSGYNYTDDFGLAASKVAFSRDMHSLQRKLNLGRCDLVPDRCEIIRGFSAIGKPIFDALNIAYSELPDGLPTPFYMMFPKNEEGAALRDVINAGITRMEISGRMAELRSAYKLANPPETGHRERPPQSESLLEIESKSEDER